MKLDPQTLQALQSLAPIHRGVFTISDLATLVLARGEVEAQQKIRPFLKAKILYRFCRGFYVTPGFDRDYLSQRICPDSAISMGSVLAREMLIGSVPQKTVYAVKIGTTRVYKSELGQVIHFGFSSSRHNWFGYDTIKDGVRYADVEKAFLDTLYFYQRGHQFAFNIYSDIQVDKLNRQKLGLYLSNYKNPKFVKFVKGVLDGYDSVR